ncbi:MAG: hypothetical protein EXR70_10925 [Deltaproteobacteria bacterium]|nr:hypothetical protein [Deltaproteobacteria bacterium]
MDWQKIKFGVWSAIGGAILAMIVGFNWGGWVTGGTAEVLAKDIAENSVAKRFTPSCVARFNQDPKKEAKLKEIKAKDSWDGQKFVEEQGWATLPGEDKPDNKVAEGCAKQLMESAK